MFGLSGHLHIGLNLYTRLFNFRALPNSVMKISLLLLALLRDQQSDLLFGNIFNCFSLAMIQFCNVMISSTARLFGFAIIRLVRKAVSQCSLHSDESTMVRGEFLEPASQPGDRHCSFLQLLSGHLSGARCRSLADVCSLGIRAFAARLRPRFCKLFSKTVLVWDVGVVPSTAHLWLSTLEAQCRP